MAVPCGGVWPLLGLGRTMPVYSITGQYMLSLTDKFAAFSWNCIITKAYVTSKIASYSRDMQCLLRTTSVWSQQTALQGVPKVRSSNFMRYNFWSKVHFYMKFLKYVSYSIEYLCSEVQWLASPLCFFISLCSRCGIKWDKPCSM